MSEAQRARILAAAVMVASEYGPGSATIARIISRAGVSRKTFYEAFEDRQDCLAAVFEHGVAAASQRAKAAYDERAKWVDRVRQGLLALLEFFDEEHDLARVCFAHAVVSPSLLMGRGQVFDVLIDVIDEGRSTSQSSIEPQPLTAAGVLAGVLGLIHVRLAVDRRPLVELVNPLMSMIVLPYLGSAAANREQRRSVSRPRSPLRRGPTRDPLAGSGMRLTYRTLAVLAAIEAEPGSSNREVGEHAGVSDQGQISKLLTRLAGLDLVVNTGVGQARGGPNAWVLRRKGADLVRAVGGSAAGERRRIRSEGCEPISSRSSSF